jgi:uncharacterized membrane protein (UPF0127 family)
VRRFVTLLAVAGLCAGSAVALGRRAPLFADLPRSEVEVITNGGSHRFQVWIADNDQSRERGLMFVRTLPADQGMLFLFDRPRFASFWMHNTYLSLDIVFIRADGVVVNVARDAEPMSLQPIESVEPVTGVLELLAGTAARIRIVAGERVRHPAFGAPAPDS